MHRDSRRLAGMRYVAAHSVRWAHVRALGTQFLLAEKEKPRNQARNGTWRRMDQMRSPAVVALLWLTLALVAAALVSCGTST